MTEILDCRSKVENIEIAWIPMADGRRLAARLMLPKDAMANPVPAILEYIPYRRRDGTRARTETTTTMTADKTHFHLTATVKAFDRGKLFVERAFKESIKRDCM